MSSTVTPEPAAKATLNAESSNFAIIASYLSDAAQAFAIAHGWFNGGQSGYVATTYTDSGLKAIGSALHRLGYRMVPVPDPALTAAAEAGYVSTGTYVAAIREECGFNNLKFTTDDGTQISEDDRLGVLGSDIEWGH